VSHHTAAAAVTEALDASREDEIVVVCGERVTRVSFADLDERTKQLVAKKGIAPVAWPRRWLLEDVRGALTIYDVRVRSARSAGVA